MSYLFIPIAVTGGLISLYLIGCNVGYKKGLKDGQAEEHERGYFAFMKEIHSGTHPDVALGLENKEGIRYNEGWEDAYQEIKRYGNDI